MTVLIEPGLGRVSGGLRYNRSVADAAHGAITRHTLSGTWPDPSAQDDAALRHLAARFHEPIIVDGLISMGVTLRCSATSVGGDSSVIGPPPRSSL